MVLDARPETLPARSPSRHENAKTSTTLDTLSRLIDGFPERDVSDDAKLSRLHAYMIAVEELPLDILQEAGRRILRGVVKDMNPLFMPTPPELAKLCRAIAAEDRFRAMPPKSSALLERFAAPADPNVVAKLERFIGELTKAADIQRHETAAEWRQRMGDRITSSSK